MHRVHPVLVSLVLLTFWIGAAAAQNGNVCVHAADGAIVCGPVAQNNKPDPSPFDQPQQAIAPPGNPVAPTAALPAAEPRPLRRPPVREATRAVRPPKHVYRQPPPREFDRHPPPPRRIAREDVRRREAERDHRPPPRVERERPVRLSEADRRRIDRNRERPPMHIDREMAARQYDNRLRELEREVRALQADRDMALRRTADRRPLPRDLRRDERYDAEPPRVHRRVARDRYSNED